MGMKGSSCRERPIQLSQHVSQVVPKHLSGPPQSTLFRERRQIEIIHRDLYARGNVIAHHLQPVLLLLRKCAAVRALLRGGATTGGWLRELI